MASMNLLLLPEWHRNVIQWKQAEFRSLIFCSFVDRDSVELALWLSRYYLYHREILPRAKTQDDDHIFLVFFPISRKLQINIDIQNRFEDLLQTQYSEDRLENKVGNFIEYGQKFIEKSYREFELQQRWQDQAMELFSPISMQDKRNRYIFGPIGAKYLKEIVYFPKIFVGDQIYNGIPLNFTVTSFLEKILLPELCSVVNFS
jgi:hypothetical protein